MVVCVSGRKEGRKDWPHSLSLLLDDFCTYYERAERRNLGLVVVMNVPYSEEEREEQVVVVGMYCIKQCMAWYGWMSSVAHVVIVTEV